MSVSLARVAKYVYDLWFKVADLYGEDAPVHVWKVYISKL